MGESTETVQGKEFQVFIWARIIGALVIAVFLIWGSMKMINLIYPDNSRHSADSRGDTDSHTSEMYNEDAALSDQASFPGDTHGSDTAHTGGPNGVAFVEALIAPIDYELSKRLWGWRPNDAVKITDNVNEYQLGVLQVTRKVSQRLRENISRTGSTAVINKYLERATDSLMIRSDSMMIPSAESSYNEAIKNLNRYKEQLVNGEASFYTRTDNLIPLLSTMVELMGSCDEKLVRRTEDDGKPVSTFDADNYYYYAKGVASAMLPILHAIEQDFNKVLETRNGSEILHHAITSCHHASEMKPWLFVTEGNLNGIIANHRANMATSVSHARFYLGLLVITLST